MDTPSCPDPDPVVTDVTAGVMTVVLNRPARRNAVDVALLHGLRAAMASAEADAATAVVVLTGADPAFCAGLDLEELRRPTSALAAEVGAAGGAGAHEPWTPITKPVVGAVNGPAVTGGLEIALHCDILVASDRAAFADTHARVGVLPGWGLSARLPTVVGRSRARQMSLTGEFLTATEALNVGLVSEVVEHERVVSRAREIAARVADNDQRGVRAMLAAYRAIEVERERSAMAIEARAAATWKATALDLAETGSRRAEVVARGRVDHALDTATHDPTK